MKHLFKRPKLIITVVVLATAAFGAVIPSIIIDNDIKNYFPKSHPSYLRKEKVAATYGSLSMMDISIQTSEKTIFTEATIKTVRDFTDELERLKGVERVKSLTNTDYIVGIDGGLSAETLVPKDFVATPENLLDLRKRAIDWKSMYGGLILSDDFRGTQIVVSVEKDLPAPEVTKLFHTIRDLTEKYEKEPLKFRMAGDPVIFELTREYMITDLIRLVPLVSLVVLLCLFFSFRNLEGTVLPLITVIVSTTWTVGLMALVGAHFTVISSCIPIVLIAVGSAYGIHVVNHYYNDLRETAGQLTPEKHRELVMESLGKVVKPVFLAGVTTVAGFASNLTSPVVPLKDFSLFSAIGVTMALVMSLVLIPALLMVKPVGKTAISIGKEGKGPKEPGTEAVRTFAKAFSTLRRNRIPHIIVTSLVVAAALTGASKLNIESSMIKFFDENSEFRKDVAYIDGRFAGTNLLSLIVKGKEKGDLTDPAILSAMDELDAYLIERHPEIGKTISFPDFVRRMNKVMHVPQPEAAPDAGGDSQGAGEAVASFFDEAPAAPAAKETTKPAPKTAGKPAVRTPATGAAELGKTYTASEFLALLADARASLDSREISADRMVEVLERKLNYGGAAYDEIPVDTAKYPVADKSELKNLVAQYLLLYSGSLDQFINDPLRPSESRIMVQLKSHNTGTTDAIIRDAKDFAAGHFPAGYTIEASGIAELEVALSDMIVSSQISSIVIAAIAVVIIMMISYRSLIAGIIGVVPLTISILINFAIMGFLKIDLDMVTSLVSSIAIGIGIDYTIHFIENYHLERLRFEDLDTVTIETLKVSGKAILVNALSVGLGFLVLTLSNFVVLRHIGLLVAIIMLTSSVPAMTLLPLILNVFKPAFISKPIEPFRFGRRKKA